MKVQLKGLLTIAFFISLLSLFCFSLMAFFVSRQQVTTFDQMVISAVQGKETPTLTAIMKTFTFIGSTNSIIVITILILFFLYKVLHHRTELLFFLAVLIGTPIINYCLKTFFQRARPELHRLIDIGGYSFPSGHAMSAFAVYGTLAFLLWRHIPTQWGRTVLIVCSSIMILMIGISRIYLGVHYPTDIIAGYFASGFWLMMAITFYQHYMKKKEKEIETKKEIV